MSYEEFKDELKNISTEELVEKAKSELRTLCETGGSSFRMCVPVSKDDTDVIFSEIIRRLENID